MDIEKLETKLAVKLDELKKVREEVGLLQNTITLLTCTEKDHECKWLDGILDFLEPQAPNQKISP
jgi:hypothetical protein